MTHSTIIERPTYAEAEAQFEALIYERARYFHTAHWRNHELDDLVAVAKYGLMEAVDNFEPKKRAKFFTHAHNMITYRLSKYTRKCNGIIHIPGKKLSKGSDLPHAVHMPEHFDGKAESNIDVVDRGILLSQCLSVLEDDERDLVKDVYMEGLPTTEIALRVGTSPQQVQHRLRIACRKINAYCEEHGVSAEDLRECLS